MLNNGKKVTIGYGNKDLSDPVIVSSTNIIKSAIVSVIVAS